MTIYFNTHPDRYRHWKLTIKAPIATLTLGVQEDAGLGDDYKLKLNSYDLGVDIELADAIERIRFEHPEVRTVIIDSALERIFCAGANIFMLGQSSHSFKVNFCKFTNETRLAIEDASQYSGLKFLAAVSGACAGGGYELALACDEIYLVDDGNSTVSLPEVPLLGVLPGTGGITRVIDKRHVRRDRADFFCTVADGIKGERAVDWKLVDAIFPTSQFKEAIQQRAQELAELSDRPLNEKGITLEPIEPKMGSDTMDYTHVSLHFDREQRTAILILKGPQEAQPTTPEAIQEAGCHYWPLQAFRELDRALLHLRFNEQTIGTILLKTQGHATYVLACDNTLLKHQKHWLVREIIQYMKRVLKRLDMTSRSIFALIEPGSCFAGSLFELALAADRSYMLDDPDADNLICISPMNQGPLKMGNGLSRLEAHFLGGVERGEFEPQAAEKAGLVTFAPDDLDWDDEIRLAIEERTALSPDSLTGMEANLRFPGPETLETKIFGRLTAWQNWIFQRPNAVGEHGALKVYGKAGLRPKFDWERT